MGWFSKEVPKRIALRTGNDLACVVCGFGKFFERQAQFRPPLFSLDWANPTGDCCVCGRCGYVHWFLGAE
jgi:hypothetical protein